MNTSSTQLIRYYIGYSLEDIDEGPGFYEVLEDCQHRADKINKDLEEDEIPVQAFKVTVEKV